GQQALAGWDVAGHRTRLDQCSAFPVLSEALIIMQRCNCGERYLCRARIRSQSQIGAKNISVACPLLHQAHEVAGKTDTEGLRLHSFTQRQQLALEEDDKIDVARVVEFE